MTVTSTAWYVLHCKKVNRQQYLCICYWHLKLDICRKAAGIPKQEHAITCILMQNVNEVNNLAWLCFSILPQMSKLKMVAICGKKKISDDWQSILLRYSVVRKLLSLTFNDIEAFFCVFAFLVKIRKSKMATIFKKKNFF